MIDDFCRGTSAETLIISVGFFIRFPIYGLTGRNQVKHCRKRNELAVGDFLLKTNGAREALIFISQLKKRRIDSRQVCVMLATLVVSHRCNFRHPANFNPARLASRCTSALDHWKFSGRFNS
jgi:hypothetical protein